MGRVLLQSKAALCHYKVGQELLQSGVDNLLQSVEIIITKWARYYKVGQILQSGLGITNWGQSLKSGPVQSSVLENISSLLIQGAKFEHLREGTRLKKKIIRSSRSKLSYRVLENSQENTCAGALTFWIKEGCNLIKKEIQAQMISYEICEIFKNDFL